MHYSPKCFISPFPTFLELGTAPASWHAREGRRKEAFHPAYYRSSPSQVRITLSAPIFAPSSKKKNNVPRVIPWILSRPRDEKIWSLRRGKAPLVRGGRSCPEEQQGPPLLSSFLFPFLSRTELPFHRVSIFPIQPRSPANVNSVGKVGRARAIACRASLSPTGFSYSARRSARPEFFQAPQRGRCPVFVPPPL